MLSKIFKYSILFILLANVNLHALAPLDMLEDGKRAFDLANWKEAKEILERFMETWPEHEKYNEALYFHTIATVKSLDSQTNIYKSKICMELEKAVASLSLELPDKDLSEAKVAIKFANKSIDKDYWEDLAKLTPSELKHYLAREWYPNPTEYPFETLKWTKQRLANTHDIDSKTISNISLIKLSALWEIIKSPIILNNSKKELESTGNFPIDKAFNKTLQEAFKNGNPDQKRKAAILGYHFDYFKTNTLTSNKKVKSRWLHYLKSRGLDSKGTWCP